MSEALKESPPDLAARLKTLRDGLLTGLVERDVPVRLALLATLAGEHLLLVGPPGTAKSLVARRLHQAFASTTYFERLLTRFTVPEELFGPLSIKGLEEDRYERLTEAYLPKASIAFLDEIFKANSAILNALLTLLNEREFDNGTRRESTPLIAVVGASNELPECEELDALFDRFLLRCHVGPVSKSGFPALLGLRGDVAAEVATHLRLSAEDLSAVQQAASAVAVPDDVVALLSELRDWCTAEKLQVSDRRWRKVVKLLQTAALTNGRNRVSIWDCWLLQHCLWNEPEQRAKVYDWYAARAGASAAMDPSRLTRIVVSWEARLKQDQDSRSQVRDAAGTLLFKDSTGKPTTNNAHTEQARRGKDLLFLAPDGARTVDPNYYRDRGEIRDRANAGQGFTLAELNPLYVQDRHYGWREFKHWSNRDAYVADKSNWHMDALPLPPLVEPTRQKPAHVEACLKELGTVRQQVETYKEQLLAHIASLDADIRTHLWVTDDFAEPAARSLGATRRVVETLLGRIEKLRQGFEMLPREQDVGGASVEKGP
ncbi:Putative 2-component regulator [Myxococcus hansupus]|uniref:Putative 2-component regulator n=1 Tax=Pseudomyxococcus hansupus TaxID=1297742 RepID=A0A0H4XPQ4_9BACT|nr:AAA family ATPase [Myxococcus hansupus]AKQ70352.1 Putative 2-component regulator [Myxococcus hansupus]